MNKARYISILVLIMFFLAPMAYAQTKTTIIFNNYDISGSNIREIKQELFVHGIKDEHENRFAAKTTPKFNWQYNFAMKENGCTIASTDVQLEINLQLPKLLNLQNLSPKDQLEWRRYYNSIYEHENGHAQISMKTAKEISLKTKNLPAEASCNKIAEQASSLIAGIFEQHQYSNVSYDKKTDHGTTQGAMLVAMR